MTDKAIKPLLLELSAINRETTIIAAALWLADNGHVAAALSLREHTKKVLKLVEGKDA